MTYFLIIGKEMHLVKERHRTDGQTRELRGMRFPLKISQPFQARRCNGQCKKGVGREKYRRAAQLLGIGEGIMV